MSPSQDIIDRYRKLVAMLIDCAADSERARIIRQMNEIDDQCFPELERLRIDMMAEKLRQGV